MAKTVLGAFAVTTLALAACVACGGGNGNGDNDSQLGLAVVRMEFLDRSRVPLDPAPTQDLPRNAVLRLVFSHPVAPESVTAETIQVRYAAGYGSVSPGSFQVDGTDVLYDPTVTAQGVPNPLGFVAVMRYRVVVPSLGEQAAVVRGEDGSPNDPSWSAEFMTSGGWLPESDPPQLIEFFWIPGKVPVEDSVSPSSILGIRFSEAMDPSSIVLGADPTAPAPDTTVDVRYTDDPLCQQAGVAGQPIAGSISPDTGYDVLFFRPDGTFLHGLPFRVVVSQVTDLAGLPIANAPQQIEEHGRTSPSYPLLLEDFADQIDLDATATTADWGTSEPGFLHGQPASPSVAQSLFLPNPGSRFAIVPSYQVNGSLVTVEFQGADAVETDRATIDPSAPHTDWEADPAACAGRTFIRFRITMIPDPVIQEGARLDFVAVW